MVKNWIFIDLLKSNHETYFTYTEFFQIYVILFSKIDFIERNLPDSIIHIARFRFLKPLITMEITCIVRDL